MKKSSLPRKVINAYGLHLTITCKNANDFVNNINKVTADHKAEVHLEILNQTKEYTLKEFCERLGVEYFLEVQNE